MCGLYGFITNKNKQLNQNESEVRNRILKSLAISMENRGTQSTGIATIKDGQTKIFKKAVPASTFVRYDEVEALLQNLPQMVIGHTRLATTGEVTDENAHPYQHGQIIGAHNGIVNNYLQIDNTVSVDSEVIFKELDKDHNDYAETFKKLSGCFALTWHFQEEPGKLFFAIHDNPLVLSYLEEIDTLFWASNGWALDAAFQAVGINRLVDQTDPKEDTTYEINPNLEVKEKKIEFKEYHYQSGDYRPAVYPYQDDYLDGWEYRNGMWQKSMDDIDSEDDLEYQSYLNSDAPLIIDLIENGRCESCAKAVNPKKGFFYDEESCTLICDHCHRHEGEFPNYRRITKSNYFYMKKVSKRFD